MVQIPAAVSLRLLTPPSVGALEVYGSQWELAKKYNTVLVPHQKNVVLVAVTRAQKTFDGYPIFLSWKPAFSRYHASFNFQVINSVHCIAFA